MGFSPAEIENFCQKWHIKELALFGSILTNDFYKQSDIDFLATFDLEFEIDLFQLYDLEEELTAMVGRKIDFIFRNSLENSHNWLRKNHILQTAEVIYVKG